MMNPITRKTSSRPQGFPSQAGPRNTNPLIVPLLSLFLLLGLLAVPAWSEDGNSWGSDTLGDSAPALSDPSIQIPVPTRLVATAKTDGQIFAEICGCLSKRVTIRKDSPDFVPVRWSMRALNGKAVRPREERGGANVVLDLAAYEPGVYVVTLVDKYGRMIARPLNVK